MPSKLALASLVFLLFVALASGVTGAQEGGNSGVRLAPPDGPWTVYLTFDDGPSSTMTPLILDALAEHDARATFFLHGNRIKGNEAIVRRILREGHTIGNHLWQQDGLTNGSGATEAELRAAWRKTENEIVRALGSRLAAVYAQQPAHLIRQPGGSAQPFPVENAITYNWHVSSGDSAPWTPGPGDPPERPWNHVYGNVVFSWFEPRRYYSVYEYGDGAIVLMHDVAPVLAVALPVILDDLAENGAVFAALPRPDDPIDSMPVLISAPPEWYAAQSQ